MPYYRNMKEGRRLRSSLVFVVTVLCSSQTVNGERVPDIEEVNGAPEDQGKQVLQEQNVFSNPSGEAWTEFQRGVPQCPCLKFGELPPLANTSESANAFFGENIDIEVFGFGCAKHERNASVCNDGCIEGSNIVPPPIDCDRTWCERSWCWVDPDNCDLLTRSSFNFPDANRFYSYAACWDMDSFTSNNRLSSLETRVLKAGFNSNSGGWLGAYGAAHPGSNVDKGKHFVGPASRWSGPVVSFVTEAARAGNFRINITEPQDYLLPHSQAHFQSSSSFDYCVYSVSLGYLDFCVAQYTVTDTRATATNWLLLGSQDIHLVVRTDEQVEGWQQFVDSTKTIFQPFTGETWLFIVFLVIPLLGGLMVVHEWGHAGSGFPNHESVVEVSYDQTVEEIKERKVPLYKHLVRSIYIGYLSVLQQSYSQSVVTYGAMMNLLGISFFILTVIAVYTANLAAILSQVPKVVTVNGIKEAVEKGFMICAERKTLEIVRSLYPDIPDDRFVVDPLYLGGDGQPGFDCSNCRGRRRVFEMVRPANEVAKNSSFCHVALAPIEDLEVEKQHGDFCYLEIVDDHVGQVQTGIPVYEGVSSELISLFLKLKSDGVYDKEVVRARPETQCPVEFRGEGSALSIQQLTGIWVVSFGFAFLGLIVTFAMPIIRKRKKERLKSVVGYDQTGQRVQKLHREESWLNNKTFMTSTRRVFVSDDNMDSFASSQYTPNSKMSNMYTTRLNDDSSSTGDGDNAVKPVGQEQRQEDILSDQSDGFNSTNGRNFRYL